MAGNEADLQDANGAVDTMSIGLPLDSDIEVTDGVDGVPRPVHLHWRYIGLVALGGAIGTGAREFLSTTSPALGQFPATILAINVMGAFLLGGLLEALVRRGEDRGGRRAIRLLVGTGIMGGFTTYSTLATDTASLFHEGAPGLAMVYAVATVVIGAGATALGIVVATAIHRRRLRSRSGGGSMSALIALVVACAGGAGAASRLVIDGFIRARSRTNYPLGTTVINVSGSLLLGLVTGLALGNGCRNNGG